MQFLTVPMCFWPQAVSGSEKTELEKADCQNLQSDEENAGPRRERELLLSPDRETGTQIANGWSDG